MSPADTDRPVDDTPPEGPGRRLRRAREAAAISIGEVSARLHLDVKTVRAIEADDYSTLPAPAFVRGYLRGYARMMNVPVEPLVASFDVHGLAPPPLVADISERPQARSSDFPVQAFTWLIVIALGILVFLWWRGQVFSSNPIAAGPQDATAVRGVVVRPSADGTATSEEDGRTSARDPVSLPSRITLNPEIQNITRANDPTAQPTPGTLPLGKRSAEGNLDTPAVGPAGGVPVSVIGATTPVTPELPPRAQSTGMQVAATESSVAVLGPVAQQGSEAGTVTTANGEPQAPATASDNGGPSPGVPKTQGEVSLTFGHDAWVEIYDRDNAKLFWNLARKGRPISITGTLPLRVLLGKTEKVKVRFNGEAVNFQPFMARGVARFLLDSGGIAAVPEKEATTPTSQ